VRKLLVGWMILTGCAASVAHAADAPAAPSAAAAGEAPADAASGDDVDVDAIKKKYWATGDQTEMGVVQNRLYSKAGKLQLGVNGGVGFSDPFLSLKPVGANLGFHFSEFFGAEALYWNLRSSPSAALAKLRETEKEANTVVPKNFVGGNLTASFLYGKLSLLGQAIIYYDMHLSGGGGVVETENNRSAAFTAGIGQRYFLTDWLSLRLDYRALGYTEQIKEKEITARLGEVVGTRKNYTHTILLGLDLMFGVF
jgi:outer membrane beta-barrel protein